MCPSQDVKNFWSACNEKPTIPLVCTVVSNRSTETQTGTESQITQHVRGCVSPRLFLSFSKPINLEPTLHCSPCSPARASLQYGRIQPQVRPFAKRRVLLVHHTPIVRKLRVLLLGNVTVPRTMLVHRHMLEMVFPSGRHAAVAVDLRKVVQNAGRLVRGKGGEGVPVRGVRFCKVYDIAR